VGCSPDRSPRGGTYRPRKPRASALYQCAHRHAAELRAGGRYQRLFEERVIERFLECGDPHHGFRRFDRHRCNGRTAVRCAPGAVQCTDTAASGKPQRGTGKTAINACERNFACGA